MYFLLYYVAAMLALILYFLGYLTRWEKEWVIIVFAVTIFPAMVYL